MKLMEKLAKKVASSMSVAVSDTVKDKAKDMGVNAIPTLIGLAVLAAGIIAFRSSTKSFPGGIPVPTAKTVSVITNNYFFDEALKGQVLSSIMGK